MKQESPHQEVRGLVVAVAILLVFGSLVAYLALCSPESGLMLSIPAVLAFGMLLRGRDSRREFEEQAAFEEAERERAEQRASAAFESFINSSPISIEVYKPDGALIVSNRAAERLLGKSTPPGVSLLSEQGLKRAGLLEPQLKRVLAGSRVETPPTWYDPIGTDAAGSTGRRVCFRATVFPLFDAEGRVSRIAVMHENITELKKLEQELAEARETNADALPSEAQVSGDAREVEFRRRKVEQALRESEERYRAFVRQASGYAVLRFSADGRAVAVSPSVRDIWGLSAETVQADPSAFFAQVHSDDVEAVRRIEAEARGTGEYPQPYRFRVTNKHTGKVHWVEAKGSVTTVLGKRAFDLVVLDVTGEHNVAEQLKEQRRLVDSMTSSTADGFVLLDSKLTVKQWSKGAETELGIPPAEAEGRPLEEVCPGIENTGFFAVIKESVAKGTRQWHEGPYEAGPEQKTRWMRLCCYPYQSGLLLLLRNTTEVRQTEQAWREASGRLEGLLTSPGLAVAIKDAELRYTLANAEALRMMGVSPREDLVGKRDMDILEPRIASLLESRDREALKRGEHVALETALPDAASPDPAWYRVVKSPFTSEPGKPACVLSIGYDISRRVAAEQEAARRHEYLKEYLNHQTAALREARKELRRWTSKP